MPKRRARVAPLAGALFNQQGRQEAVLEEHEAILGAPAPGDAQAACPAIDHHLESTLKVPLEGRRRAGPAAPPPFVRTCPR
ncbi:GntR family transcriptional regulator [Streptomyces sparsogenes DSM 40356]|uniref:GntR family transcriptional regulator n=1 Tax=Streptomyces sparsogenes DSM 40356 TaxID=1331668 RepID=A0A1R1SAW7_9ACTN|nr:GntR family transcriptional regulator [Streptomyces sparsogenes DSM 40356]